MRSRLLPFLTLAASLAAGAAAAQPAGGPVVFSLDAELQSCIIRQPSRDGGYDVLALERCTSPAAQFVFDAAARRIRPASSPDLCLSDPTGAGVPPYNMLLRPCSDEGVGQFYTYDAASRRLLSLNSDNNRPDRDSYCAYLGRQRGNTSPIVTGVCSQRAAREAHNTWTMAPASRVPRPGG